MFRVLGWIVWGIDAFLALSWAYGLRTYAKKRQSFPNATAVQTFFFWVLAVAFLLTGYSKLHIFWLAPLCFFASLYLVQSGVPILTPVVMWLTSLFLRTVMFGLDLHYSMTPPSKAASEFETSYSRISDEEVFHLTDQKDSLRPAARQVLAVELRKRRLNFVARAIAEAILGGAISSAQKVEQEFWAKASKSGKFSDEHFQAIVAEFVYLFLNLCDRDAYLAIPDPQKRGVFLDSVIYYLLQIGKAKCMTVDHAVPAFTRREERPDPMMLVVMERLDDLSERQKGYSGPLFAAPDAPLAGTVFWKFGEHIAQICDRYDRHPPSSWRPRSSRPVRIGHSCQYSSRSMNRRQSESVSLQTIQIVGECESSRLPIDE